MPVQLLLPFVLRALLVELGYRPRRLPEERLWKIRMQVSVRGAHELSIAWWLTEAHCNIYQACDICSHFFTLALSTLSDVTLEILFVVLDDIHSFEFPPELVHSIHRVARRTPLT